MCKNMASTSYKQKLSQWGLDAFMENFEVEGIDDESFSLLNDSVIETLIPRVGPRLIFKKKFEEFKLRSQELFSNTDTISNVSTETWSPCTSIYSYVPDRELTETLNLNFENTISADVSKRSLQEENIFPSKRIKTTNPIKSVFPQGLEKALQKYPDGQIILHKNKLTNDCRSKLTKLIISEIFGIYGTEIRADIFMKTASEIKTLFPNENTETYYIPYDSVNKCGPRGKLYTKYINTKAALKLANTSLILPDTPNKENNTPCPEIIDAEKKCLDFLKISTEPFTKVLEAWEQSFRVRRKLYMNSSLSEIYEEFPCLRLNSGLELIETDFNRRFPDSIDIIYSTWGEICACIAAEIKERNINVCSNTDPDPTTYTLLSLPFLLNPVTLKKGRKGTTWRPSRSEVQESFFVHIPSLDQLEDKVKARTEKLAKYGLTIQPFGVITGDLRKPSYIIVVNETQYVIESGVRALELLYKLFHALDVEYPAESEPLWLSIQELVFKLKPVKSCSSAATLISDILFHKVKTTV